MSALKKFVASAGLMVAAATAQGQDRPDPVVDNLSDKYKLAEPVRRIPAPPGRMDRGTLIEIDVISDDGSTVVTMHGNDKDNDGIDPQDIDRIKIRHIDPEAPGTDNHTDTTTTLTKGSKTVTQWRETASETYAMPAGYASVKGNNIHEDIKTVTTSDQSLPICSDAAARIFKNEFTILPKNALRPAGP